MSYTTISEELVVCSICHKVWRCICKEDQSGSGWHAFMRHPHEMQVKTPCLHFNQHDVRFHYSVDQQLTFTEVKAHWAQE